MNEGDEKKDRTPFSPDQQARVQDLIDSAYKRAYSKATGIGGRKEEVRRLEDEIDKFKEYKKNVLLTTAISKHDVVDINKVIELVSPHLDFDYKGTLVDISGAVGAEEYIAAWLGERPHHLRKEEGKE